MILKILKANGNTLLARIILGMVLVMTIAGGCWLPVAIAEDGAEIEVVLSADAIGFQVPAAPTAAMDADKEIRVNVVARTGKWAINYQAQPLRGQAGEIPAKMILMRTPYSGDFQPADVPRLAAAGGKLGPPAQEVARLRFRLALTGKEMPGAYYGILVSPDGGPTIHVSAVIEARGSACPMGEQNVKINAVGGPDLYAAEQPVQLELPSWANRTVQVKTGPLTTNNAAIPAIPGTAVLINGKPAAGDIQVPADNLLHFSVRTEWAQLAATYKGISTITVSPGCGGWTLPVRLLVDISPYTVMSLTPNAISFRASQPGLHDADRQVQLTIGSSAARWGVRAESEGLKGVSMTEMIPGAQLFIKAVPVGADVVAEPGGVPVYQDLGSPRSLVRGVGRMPSVASDLAFRLKTTIQDAAGDYTGAIRFTCLENP